MRLALKSQKQINDAFRKATNRGVKPSNLFQNLIDAMPLHPDGNPEIVTIPHKK